jgi:hypothetical protein
VSDEELSAMWREHNARSKERRARNRANSPKVLDREAIPYTVHNNGFHLIVSNSVDFWPGTGLWQVRGTNTRGRGVMTLVRLIKNTQPKGSDL